MFRIATALFTAILVLVASPAGAAPIPSPQARAALLLDNRTGEVLYALNADQPNYIASLTKIITAVLLLESGRIDESFVTSANATLTPPTSLRLTPGQAVTGRELLGALLVMSANDAAVVIAEGLAGSVAAFAAQMTARAHELGAVNTSFRNPHGLHHPDHISTARDVAVITRHALGLADFRAVVGMAEFYIDSTAQRCVSTNPLLYGYPGASGVKTGYTSAAGSCLVATADRQGLELLAVVLGAPAGGAGPACIDLLDYGFELYQWHQVAAAGQVLTTARAAGARQPAELAAARAAGLMVRDPGLLELRFALPELRAPLAAGCPAGHVDVFYRGHLLESVPLVVVGAVPRSGPGWWVWLVAAAALVWLRRRLRAGRRPHRYRLPQRWRPGR